MSVAIAITDEKLNGAVHWSNSFSSKTMDAYLSNDYRPSSDRLEGGYSFEFSGLSRSFENEFEHHNLLKSYSQGAQVGYVLQVRMCI